MCAIRAAEIASGCPKPFGSVSPPLRWLRRITLVLSCSNTGSFTERVMQPVASSVAITAISSARFMGLRRGP